MIVFFLGPFYRLQTIYRLARGGQSYKIDIYLRNWSIRTELKRRACFYNIENESFSQPELSRPTEQRLNRNDENNMNRNSGISAGESLPITATTVYPIKFQSSGQRQTTYEIRSNTANDNDHQYHHDRVADQQGQQRQQQRQDLLYQKQYCNEIKVIRSDLMMHTNDVNIEIISEINTTARKHTTVSPATMVTAAVSAVNNDNNKNNNMEIDTLRILCEKNELIVDRCGTIRQFSGEKAAIDAKQRSTPTITTATIDVRTISTKNPTNVGEKSSKIRPLTTVPKCVIDKAAVKSTLTPTPPQRKLKTQNTFTSRLLLTRILDNI